MNSAGRGPGYVWYQMDVQRKSLGNRLIILFSWVQISTRFIKALFAVMPYLKEQNAKFAGMLRSDYRAFMVRKCHTELF